MPKKLSKTMDDEDDEVVGVPTPEDEEGFEPSYKANRFHSVRQMFLTDPHGLLKKPEWSQTGMKMKNL
jgi:hypothetical protein